MTIRMWIVETDKLGMTDRKFYIDDPIHVPRVGEFVDGDLASGTVHHVQWNARQNADGIRESNFATVYVYLACTEV